MVYISVIAHILQITIFHMLDFCGQLYKYELEQDTADSHPMNYYVALGWALIWGFYPDEVEGK